jgi:hypothetical protein
MIDDVEVREAEGNGLGVFALRAFHKGEFIFRRRHMTPISNQEVPSLSANDQMHLCEIDFDTSAVILPPGCYLNHSCDPNGMRSGTKVFAWSDIQKDDEITIDYRLNAFDDASTSMCACKSPSCTGNVTWSFFALDEERQRTYLSFAPSFIRREYGRRRRDPTSRGGLRRLEGSRRL